MTGFENIYDQKALEQDLSANHGRPYQQCSMSVMDTIGDPEITFDENGVCHYYQDYLKAEETYVLKGKAGEAKVEEWVKILKENGRGKKYDCLLGVSGGVDSTYLAYKAKELGLRVLCVHFDNGWNSELAVQNIEHIVSKCGFDLYTYVINWEEFKDIQLSFFKAHVIDIEAVTDIAIFAALDKICSDHKLNYILDGRNVVTEEVLPDNWTFKNTVNLKDIHDKFGTVPLKTYPIMNIWRETYLRLFQPFVSVQLLNYLPYHKKEVKQIIMKELGWKDYGGKHYESVFTRFYQGYILPKKFNVDKRKAHLSNLIFSGQITKEEALEELKQPICSAELIKEDKEFALKKLGFSEAEFDAYIAHPPIPHTNYAHSSNPYERYPLLKILRPAYRLLKKIKGNA